MPNNQSHLQYQPYNMMGDHNLGINCSSPHPLAANSEMTMKWMSKCTNATLLFFNRI